ncbi:excalibur calcium-binding domain-containing protein [Paludifilum halophilum]|uniref:Excalibur calcium-binding domain-containing protein n=1 Tax=Paludifilum halophilum TaxID=1642702 RepID=A0A235B8H1_9BACL|nr:excalibur calcium-binding domain-containing protein [Paludifilum halophilum]OYD08561.1 hypothetical protein CHM34_06970 [Paludifilum halophilum]
MKKIAGIVSAFLLVFALAPVSAFASPADKNCSDFSAWEDAQRFYEENGGPAKDPHDLDRDNDGLACDTLAGFVPDHEPGSFVGDGDSSDDSNDSDSGKEEKGGEMPKTATNDITLSLVGGVTALSGLVLYFVRRRVEQ